MSWVGRDGQNGDLTFLGSVTPEEAISTGGSILNVARCLNGMAVIRCHLAVRRATLPALAMAGPGPTCPALAWAMPLWTACLALGF